MKSVTELRYSLLPFMYTQFYYSHVSGSSVIQPLFFVLVIVLFIFMPSPAIRHFVFGLCVRQSTRVVKLISGNNSKSLEVITSIIFI